MDDMFPDTDTDDLTTLSAAHIKSSSSDMLPFTVQDANSSITERSTMASLCMVSSSRA